MNTRIFLNFLITNPILGAKCSVFLPLGIFYFTQRPVKEVNEQLCCILQAATLRFRQVSYHPIRHLFLDVSLKIFRTNSTSTNKHLSSKAYLGRAKLLSKKQKHNRSV